MTTVYAESFKTIQQIGFIKIETGLHKGQVRRVEMSQFAATIAEHAAAAAAAAFGHRQSYLWL
jgi:hypothetical protein